MHIHVLDTYSERASVIHCLDGRVKLALTLLFILTTAVMPDGAWFAYAFLAAWVWGFVLLSRLGAGWVQRRSIVVLPFALAAITVLFTEPGRPWLSAHVFSWNVRLTDAGVVRFVTILLKSWLSVQMAIVLTASTPFPLLLQAMRSLGLPQVLVAIVGFTYRYIFVIGDEALRMLRARSARSGDPNGRGGGNLLWRARVTGGMAGSLFLRSIERSERIYHAMVARGYNGEVRSMHRLTWQPRDLWLSLPFVLGLMGIWILGYWGR